MCSFLLGVFIKNRLTFVIVEFCELDLASRLRLLLKKPYFIFCPILAVGEYMIKRSRKVSLLALPFAVVIWFVGWVFFWVDSKKQDGKRN